MTDQLIFMAIEWSRKEHIFNSPCVKKDKKRLYAIHLRIWFIG